MHYLRHLLANRENERNLFNTTVYISFNSITCIFVTQLFLFIQVPIVLLFMCLCQLEFY